jgi:hypothetical protein
MMPSSAVSKVNLIASAENASKLLGKVEGAVITNGKVELLLFKEIPVVGSLSAYTGSETVRVKLCIRDKSESAQVKGNQRVDPDFIFPSVTFENGVAAVKLDDAFKVGFITITDIPGVYNNSGANIRFTRPDENKKGTTYIHDTKGEIKDGTLTVKYYRAEEGDYMPYTGAMDITVTMGSAQDTVSADMMALGLRQAAVPLRLLFKAQMAGDNVSMGFAQGVKQ